MWKLKDLTNNSNMNHACINGKYVPARPENFKKRYMPFKQRISNAWEVYQCRAEAFKWPEGQ